MGVLQRILKNLFAMFLSNIISILTELVVPVVFLRSYGKTGYADWLVLTAAVSYLSTLNFGLQTFVNQDLAMRLSRGEQESFHVEQSTALRALLGVVVIAAAACLVIFFLPIERYLGLNVSHATASLTLYFIALQVLVGSLIFSYFSGNYMGAGLAHRGSNWNNAQRFGNAALLTLLAWQHMPLSILALGQFLWYLVLLAAMLLDQKLVAPQIFPSLWYWNFQSLKTMLPASGYFGMIYWSTFLCYELPLILLRKITGPAAVVMLVLGRKIFGLSRQVLNGLTQSMGPEITRIFGEGSWPDLLRLYTYSERMIFALIAMMNIPLFIFSPVLLHLWIHRPELFSMVPFLLIASINTVLCVKEHKVQFQFSTNTHKTLAKVMFISYVAMSGISVLTIRRFGLSGFLSVWLITELVQTLVIMRLNSKLFEAHERLKHHYAVRLMILAISGLGAGAAVIHVTLGSSYLYQAAAGSLVAVPVILCAFLIFGLRDLSSAMKHKLLARFRPTAA